LYVGYCQVTKERKSNYYVNKISLEPVKRDKLRDMVSRLSQLKINMQKSPITIEEDLQELKDESEAELVQLMKELE